MKKLAILFLLTTVLVSFTFAQATVKGGLEFNNLTEGNKGKLTPVLYTEISGEGKTELGPGSIGVGIQAGTGIVLQEDSYPYAPHGDNFLKGFYELPAGPGTLTFALSTWAVTVADVVGEGTLPSAYKDLEKFGTSPLFAALHFNVGYAGLAAGPATLGFEVEYDFNTTGVKSSGDYGVFADGTKVADKIDLKVTADFAFGLGIEYHFNYVIADPDNYIAEIAKLNVGYTLPSIPLKIGAELSGTGGLDGSDQRFFGGDGTTGLTFKPYAEYDISEKLKAGLEIPIAGINADDAKQKDIEIGVGVWIKYAF
ncbi:MAG: hypothetical protein LBG26_05980 [Treponema sp.]|jgi:hypothetical protein|nr:hypothetical protein [Treponema sp.]